MTGDHRATIDVADYRNEVREHEANRPEGYHPATAREPRRILTWNGDALAGSNNGEGRNDWRNRPNVTVHMAVTGSGYAYGASMAACNTALELSEQADLSDLVKARDVDPRKRCGRPGCRVRWALVTDGRPEA